MTGRKIPALCIAIAAFSLSTTAAFAKSETGARAAVAEAKGKIEANDQAGISGSAADAQNRAREALLRAQAAIKYDKEDLAYSEASSASALATLAQATAELNRITTERDQLATR